LPATNERWDANGWLDSLKGDNNNFLFGSNVITGSIKSDIKKGYHGCVGHNGTIIVPVALSFIIFLKERRMSAKGGKA